MYQFAASAETWESVAGDLRHALDYAEHDHEEAVLDALSRRVEEAVFDHNLSWGPLRLALSRDELDAAAHWLPHPHEDDDRPRGYPRLWGEIIDATWR
jgi:hypothetical protein